MTESNFLFFKDCTTATTSKALNIIRANALYIDVSGDATHFNIEVCGKVDNNGEYIAIAGINLSTLEVVQSVTANGLYTFDVNGFLSVIAKVTDIASGAVSCFGRSVE